MNERDDPTRAPPDDALDPAGDPLLAELAGLPAPDVDDLRARRIRAAGHAALARGAARPRLRHQVAVAAQSVLLVGASAAYLGWAFHAVIAFYR